MENPTTSRRGFIQQLAVLAGIAMVPPALRGSSSVNPEEQTNEQICQRKFALALKESLQSRPMGELMIAVGNSFIGTPYVANTLEQPGQEHLVVNLQGLDCVTFVENTLALSRCIKLRGHTFKEYKKQLQLVRYRGGRIDGYPSRLHYFSDWIDDNEKKQVVRNISREVGGVAHGKSISFMSSHPSSYKQLSDKRFMKRTRQVESLLNSRTHHYIPKDQLRNVEHKLESGDILGITTSIEGLDIIHTGIAFRINGILKYLHAPLSGGQVQITEHSLVDYLAMHDNQTGVMIARPLEPVS